MRRSFLQTERADVRDLKEQKTKLKYRLQYAQTDEFIEERARKLGMHKENEAVLMVRYPTPTSAPRRTAAYTEPVYRAWLRIFSLPQ